MQCQCQPTRTKWRAVRATARVRYCRREPRQGVLRDSVTSTDDTTIHQISAPELKAMIDRGDTFQLVDVRTPQEQAIAAIAGARLLDREYHDALLALDRVTP